MSLIMGEKIKTKEVITDSLTAKGLSVVGETTLTGDSTVEGNSVVTGTATAAGGFILPSFEVAELPVAAENEGVLVHCSNGAAGSPCLAYSNGTNWLQIALGGAVSAT